MSSMATVFGSNVIYYIACAEAGGAVPNLISGCVRYCNVMMVFAVVSL